MNPRNFGAIGVLALTTLFWFSSGLPNAVAQQKPQVVITYSENIYSTIAVVAIEKGFLAAEGLDVESKSEGTATDVLASLIGGSTDFGVASTSRMIAIANKKMPVMAVALNSYGFTSSVVVPKKDATTKTMADLKGKNIGVQVGTGTYGVWARYLKTIRLSPKDFSLRNMDNPLIPAAIESGSIDGAVTWEPVPSILVSKGMGRVILNQDDLAKPVKSTYPFFLITSKRFIEQKPEIVQKVVNAWARSVKFIREKPEETTRIMRESLKKIVGKSFSADEVKRQVYLTHYDRIAIDDADVQDTVEIGRVFFEEGKSKSLPDIKAHVDNRFAQKAKDTK